MMIAASPLTPFPSPAAGVAAEIVRESPAGPFTLTLAGLAGTPDGGLTAPLISATVPAQPADAMFAAQPVVALFAAVAKDVAATPATPGAQCAIPTPAAATPAAAAQIATIAPAPEPTDLAGAAPGKAAPTPSAAPAAVAVPVVAEPAVGETTSLEAMRSELAAENPAIDQPATPQISPAVLSATARPAIAETATQARSDAPAEATRKGGKPARAAAQPDGVVAGPGAAPDAAPALALNSPAPSAALATAKPALVQDAPSAETVVSDPLAEILANQAPPPPALVQVQSVAQPEPTIAGSKSGAELGFADRALRPGLAGAENALAAATTVSTSGPAGPVTADSPAFAIAPDAQPASAPVAPATAGLPSPMLGQTIAPTATHPASLQHVYPTQSAPPPGTVTAQPGRIGREMGVEIARRVASGQEEMLIRLNPQDMGRIEVRLSFDDSGAVRAVLASESPAALEMLRRDTGDLARSLADAGVRSDAQSFRFDRSGGESGWQRGQSGQGGQSGQSGREQHGGPYQAGAEDDQDLPAYRQLRGSGQLNLLA